MKLQEAVVVEQNDNENDPEILIPGIGRYRLGTAKNRVRQMLEDLLTRVKDPEGDWGAIDTLLNDKKLLQTYVKAIADAEKNLVNK